MEFENLISRAARRAAPAGLLAAALLLSSSALAMTNALTYAATFGRYDADGKVARADLTTNVEMTVALYGQESAGRALWCRRLTVPVWDGQFVVDLEDGYGESDLDLDPQYARLSDALTNASSAAAWWVGVSKLRIDGQTPSAVKVDAPRRGKLTAVPFALEAERAVEARGDFTVGGVATARNLTVSESLLASNVLFGAKSSFGRHVTVGECGLVVTGLFTRPQLGLVNTVRASRLTVTKTLTAANLCVTGGVDTTVTAASDGFAPARGVTVLGTLSATESLSTGGISADSVVVTGTLALGSGGKIDWHAVGGTQPSLVAPAGVYSDETTPTAVYASGGAFAQNASGKDVLATHAMAASARVNLIVTNGNDAVTWCKVGNYAGVADNGAVVGVTTLTPLAPGDSGGTMGMYGFKDPCHHVLTRTHKELAK